MILRTVIVMVATSLILLGCNDQTQSDNSVEYSGALSLSKLESRDQLGAMPRADNGSSGTLLPVDDASIGDLRFRVQASNQDQGIDQLYIMFDQMESADFFEGVAFSLCDSNCGFDSVDAWVSGLSLVDLDYFGPFAADIFEGNINFDNAVFSLWVESDGTLQQVANASLDTWSYGSLQDVGAAYSDGQLIVSWSPIEAAHQYMIEVYEAADSGGSEGGPMPGSEQAVPILVRSGYTGDQGVVELPSDVRAQDIGRIVLYAINSQGLFALSITDDIAGLPPIGLNTQYINVDTVSRFPTRLFEGNILGGSDITDYEFDLSVRGDPIESGNVCFECILYPSFETPSMWEYSPMFASDVFQYLNIPEYMANNTEPAIYSDAIELTLTGPEEHTLIADLVVMTNPLRVVFEDLLTVRSQDGVLSFSGRIVDNLDSSLTVDPEDELNRIDRFEYTYLNNMEIPVTENAHFQVDGPVIDFDFNISENDLSTFGEHFVNLLIADVVHNKEELQNSFTGLILDDTQPEFTYLEVIDDLDFSLSGEIRTSDGEYEVIAVVPGFAIESGGEFFLGNSSQDVQSTWSFGRSIDSPPEELTQEGTIPIHVLVLDGEATVSRFETTATIVVDDTVP